LDGDFLTSTLQGDSIFSGVSLDTDDQGVLAWYASSTDTETVSRELQEHEFVIGSARTTLGLASIGYVLWALRGGMFMATMYAGIPSWRMIDPTTLLNAYRDDGMPKDRVEELLSQQDEPIDSNPSNR
jgi:hypothetical protein